jgi:hypothetical protein
MSSETWQEILQVLAPLPWVAFFVAFVWFKVLDVRDDAAERGQANAFAPMKEANRAREERES